MLVFLRAFPLKGDSAEYPDKPPRMRWTTYNRLMDRLVAADGVAEERLKAGALATVFLDELADAVAALAAAFFDMQHVELALDVTEDEKGARHLALRCERKVSSRCASPAIVRIGARAARAVF